MKKNIILILLSIGAMVSHAQTAMEIAQHMYPGWNLGNTLEPGPCDWLPNKLDYETAWQGTKTSQQVIDLVKSQGFKSVRIPCSWFVHMDADYNIDPQWMNRVKEVVDYCINDSLYVVLNDHYDSGWIESSFENLTEESMTRNRTILAKMWAQIAISFRDYDNHLLFAGMNEPNAAGDGSKHKEADVEALVKYQQTFVNTVRQTGGKNQKRILVVQAPSTSIDLAYNYDVLPTDKVADAMMLEVHFYSPFNFCMMSKDESWGYQAYYWGSGNHVAGSKYNATWGEETYIGTQMRQMRSKYTSKGIPVILGEFGALWRQMPDGESQEKHDASVYSWYKSVCTYAVRNGVIPFVWDTNNCKRPSMDVLNRKTLTVFNQHALNGIIDGCNAVEWPYTAIQAPSVVPQRDVVYSLAGLRLNDVPNKGFYIMNGKKYLK